MTEREKQMFGMSADDIRTQYLGGLGGLYPEMTAMGVLSDAQEMLAVGQTDVANKYMNIAKFILSEIMQQKRAA